MKHIHESTIYTMPLQSRLVPQHGTHTCPPLKAVSLAQPCGSSSKHLAPLHTCQSRTACRARLESRDFEAETPLRSLVASSFTVAQSSSSASTSVRRGLSSNSRPGMLGEFVGKLQQCFKIFFPERPKELSPKEEVKRRLKMVLVADRCGMSPGSITDLKKTIAKALQDFVDIDSEDSIEVNISSDPSLGTVYCVNIPVRRVKPEARFNGEGQPKPSNPDGMSLEWDPSDWNSDPSGRFPMGC